MRNYSWFSLLLLTLVVFILTMGSCFTINVPQRDGQLPASEGDNPPVINTFSSSPINIAPGGSATLSWQVTGANTVNIDNGIGSVSLSGSRSVSPIKTTIYTLTATGPGGSHTATVEVTLGASSGTTNQDNSAQLPLGVLVGLPVINSFTSSQASGTAGSYTLSWNVSNASSVGIIPGIGNVALAGTKTVTPTSTTTYILSAKNAYGVKEKSVTVTPFSHVYETGVVNVNQDEQVLYDFIQKAPSATWMTGLLSSKSSVLVLSFPGTTSDSTGYACYQLNTKLNNGITYAKLLETHPRWVDDGFISGTYKDINVPTGAKIKVKVGIISGYTSGNVRFKLYLAEGNSYVLWNQVVAYAGGVKTADIDLSAYAGRNADFSLWVEANGASTQDWAAWAEAKIVR